MTRSSVTEGKALIVRVMKTSASMDAWIALAHEKGWKVLHVVGRPYAEVHCK